ncbi:hypothetical protein D0837_17260 [Bordetella avium]|uniref:hypothetical protein n=1 Tax=Bordetella avium TaxID=521 RepID=UPI000E678F9F|nr:hypothetical protein [Bordetella avium]RIQ79060.1 hypothetical protein D0837_17260 [Bordetella avium]
MQALDTITKIAGRAVELTIRGEKSFTFSFDGRDDSASARLMDFFRSATAKVTSDYDAECDHTCVYVDA